MKELRQPSQIGFRTAHVHMRKSNRRYLRLSKRQLCVKGRNIIRVDHPGAGRPSHGTDSRPYKYRIYL